MQKNVRSLLMASAALSFVMMTATPVLADDSEQEQIKALQAQLQALQKQLDAVAQSQKKTADAFAKQATATPAPTSSSSTVVSSASDALNSTGVKFTPGGYIETDTIYRNNNEPADNLSNFNTSIPFTNSANAHQSEFRISARSTRLSLLAEGTPDADTKLVGYLEGDFLGAATTSNSIETNSYTPRLRQGYLGYEDKEYGLNAYAGQTWSLTTLYRDGLNPRSEALPSTIDVALLPGFTYVRGPGLRVVKELDDNKVAIAFAAESPQVNAGGITTPTTVTTTNAGSTATFSGAPSTDIAPDLVFKTAYDPGYGHFEAFALGRFFHDNIDSTLHSNNVFAGSGGLGAVIPIVPKKVEFQTNLMAGQGIGRYGPALLPDFSFGTDGSIRPLTEYMGTVGLTARPTPTWTTYLFAGAEKVLRHNIDGVTTTSSGFGYGNDGVNNAGCYIRNGSCSAQTSNVWQVTGGFWKDIYKGSYGNMKFGVQDSLTRRNAFSDANGNAPHAYEEIFLTAFRYSPF